MQKSITWADLFYILSKKANDISSVGVFNWQEEIIIYDTNIGNEYPIAIVEAIGDQSLTITINTNEPIGVTNNGS
jgi:hypothetical protein